MRVHLLGALTATAQVASAFSDTSPFFLFSSSELLLPSKSSIQSASSLTASLKSSLSQCHSRTYVLVSQEGVDSSYFAESRWTPSLSRWMTGEDRAIRSALTVPDVVGRIDNAALASLLSDRCGAKQEEIDMEHDGTFSAKISNSITPRVLKISFPEPKSHEYPSRSKALLEYDGVLSSILETLPHKNFTVIYTTTPPPKSAFASAKTQEPASYEWPDQSILDDAPHMDLKRSVDDAHRRAASKGNVTLPDGPLFNRYQYLTPGLFMGFLVVFPLLLILYVAIRAISSLEVSYAAFEKETGPQSSQIKRAQ